MLPRMAMCSHSILVHHPTVGAEGDLLSLICVIGDRVLIQALRSVELVDDKFRFVVELHLRKHHSNKKVGLVPVEEGLQLWQLLSYVCPRIQGNQPSWKEKSLGRQVAR